MPANDIEANGSPYPDSRERGAIALDLFARNALRISSARGRERESQLDGWFAALRVGESNCVAGCCVERRSDYERSKCGPANHEHRCFLSGTGTMRRESLGASA